MRPGPKPNMARRLEVYHAWKLLHNQESMEEIGRRFGLSKSRVCQIIAYFENGKRVQLQEVHLGEEDLAAAFSKGDKTGSPLPVPPTAFRS